VIFPTEGQKLPVFIVSDQTHFITAILSKNCVKSFDKCSIFSFDIATHSSTLILSIFIYVFNCNNRLPGSLAKARGGVIELLDYNFILTNKDHEILLFVSQVNWIGCQGSDIFGEPKDISIDLKLREFPTTNTRFALNKINQEQQEREREREKERKRERGREREGQSLRDEISIIHCFTSNKNSETSQFYSQSQTYLDQIIELINEEEVRISSSNISKCIGFNIHVFAFFISLCSISTKGERKKRNVESSC
jgi:hypothetical protein